MIEKFVQLAFAFGVADGLLEGQPLAGGGDDVSDVILGREFQIVDAFVESPEASGEPVRVTRQGQQPLQLVLGQQEESRVLQTLVLHQILQVLLQQLDLLNSFEFKLNIIK